MAIFAYVANSYGLDHITWFKLFRYPVVLMEFLSILFIFGIFYQINKSSSNFSSKSDSRKNVIKSRMEEYYQLNIINFNLILSFSRWIIYIRLWILAMIFVFSMVCNIMYMFELQLLKAAECKPVEWTYLIGIIYIPSLYMRCTHGLMLFVFLILSNYSLWKSLRIYS